MRRETSCYPCLCPLCQATAHRLQAPALLLHKSGIIFLAYLLARKQKNVFSKTSNGSFKMHTEITWMLSETFSETGKHTTATEKSACLSCIQSSPVLSSLGSPKCFTGCTFISITVPFGPFCHLFFSLATNSLGLPSTSIQTSVFDRRLPGVWSQCVPIMNQSV